MKRIVLKVGSAVLSEYEKIAKDRMLNLVEFISELKKSGLEVILVTSGAVAAGYTEVKLDKKVVSNRQALASIGQPLLMATYHKKFDRFGVKIAQVLLTADDFDSRRQTEHASNAINTLLASGVVPIINENDVTATEELVFGDNDRLSAHVAHYFGADILVILTDIDGYYDKNPREHKDAKLKTRVHEVTQTELELARSPNSEFATGGIVTKLMAAKFLLDNNKEMFLCSGFDLSCAREFLLKGDQIAGTLFKK